MVPPALGHSPRASRASITWPTISPGVRLRTRRMVPVWQNRQFSVQPTWLDTHSVPRSASGMNTISKSCPSAVRSSHLRVPSLECWASTISGRPITKRSASQGRMVLAMSVIASNSVTPRWYSQWKTCLARSLAALASSPAAANSSAMRGRGSPSRSTRPSARGVTSRGTGTGSMCPGIGMRDVSAMERRDIGPPAGKCQRGGAWLRRGRNPGSRRPSPWRRRPGHRRRRRAAPWCPWH